MYENSLRSLRAKLEAPALTESASFVASRSPAAPQQTTEDILERAAVWLRDIRLASSEMQSKYAKQESAPQKSALESFVEGTKKGFEQAEAAKERKEAFIKRRSEDSPSTYAPQRSFETPVPVDAEVSNVLDAIAAVESQGSGDYAAVGPVVEKGRYKGQRAYGRYQVMEANIAPWTQEALGRSLSVEEFMNDPSAQDAVAAHQLTKAKNKYGTWEDAASVWFSGRPVAKAGEASDGYNTVPEYITKFRKNFTRT